MKKIILKATALSLMLALSILLSVSCSGACAHVNNDADMLCDLCGEEMEPSPCTHKDDGGDGVCDLCGADMPACSHRDDGNDSVCDLCGAVIPCSHTDSDSDNVCDTCGEIITEPPTKEELLATADAALEGGHYKITAGFTAECDNPSYANDIQALFEGSTVEILVQGSNITVSMPGDMSFMNIRIIGNVAYVRYLNYELLESLKVKAALDADNRAELWDMLPTEPRLSVGDFAEATVSPKGDTLTCTELYSSVYDEVYSDIDLSDAVNGIRNISFADVTMTVTFRDGKYDSLVIDYSLTCDIDGETVSIGIGATMSYTYEDLDDVISPDDASSYKLVEFDTLIGLFE